MIATTRRCSGRCRSESRPPDWLTFRKCPRDDPRLRGRGFSRFRGRYRDGAGGGPGGSRLPAAPGDFAVPVRFGRRTRAIPCSRLLGVQHAGCAMDAMVGLQSLLHALPSPRFPIPLAGRDGQSHAKRVQSMPEREAAAIVRDAIDDALPLLDPQSRMAEVLIRIRRGVCAAAGIPVLVQVPPRELQAPRSRGAAQG